MKFNFWVGGINCLLIGSSFVSLGLAAPVNSPAQQQIDRNITIPATASFAALIQQATIQVATLVPELLAQNPTATGVTLRIMGERNGLEAPLLFLTVSRVDWQKNPQVQNWAKLFSYSEILLGFLKPIAPAANVAAASPQQSNVAAFLDRTEMLKNDPGYRDD